MPGEPDHLGTGPRYVYEHPAEEGLGEHHADPAHPALAERPAETFGADGAPARGPAPGETTMADLDMAHGTIVALDTIDDPEDPRFGQVMPPGEDGQVFVLWTDALGHGRRTAVGEAFFAEHFHPQGA